MNEIDKISGVIGIEDYFHQEIDQRKPCSKKLSKYFFHFWLHRQDFHYFNRNK